MRKLTEVQVQMAGDQRLLRFTTVIINVGKGPLIVRGRRDCTSFIDCPTMRIRQRIKDEAGGSRGFPVSGDMEYAGDGHDHWHVQRIETYELIPTGEGIQDEPRRGAKVGYCFFDNVRHRLDLRGAPQSPVFGGAGCGTQSSTRASMGLSVGWGDIYPWDFAYQWIDITDLPAGAYQVCATANPENLFVEARYDNDAAWQDIELTDEDLILGSAGRSACTPLPGGQPSATGDYPDSYPIFGDESTHHH